MKHTITELNDNFRRTLAGGKLLLSRAVSTLPPEDVCTIIRLVQQYSAFTPANDPYKEHDFGSIDYQGNKIFWKIDYYDTQYLFFSNAPANPNLTKRVLTIMMADEY